jgi:hypothetical protein
MKTSILRLLAAAVLATTIASTPTAASNGTEAEQLDCWSWALGCMATGGFPSEGEQACYDNVIWQSIYCYYWFGGYTSGWCGPLNSCESDPPPCDPTEPGCDA